MDKILTLINFLLAINLSPHETEFYEISKTFLNHIRTNTYIYFFFGIEQLLWQCYLYVSMKLDNWIGRFYSTWNSISRERFKCKSWNVHISNCKENAKFISFANYTHFFHFCHIFWNFWHILVLSKLILFLNLKNVLYLLSLIPWSRTNQIHSKIFRFNFIIKS